MIAITGGGTGGHLSIASAFCTQLNAQGISPIFVGSSNGQDKAWFEGDKRFKLTIFLPSVTITNKKFFAKINAVFHLAFLVLKMAKFIKTQKISKIICVGGYSAAPLSLACVFSGAKLYIHEQNFVIGRLNKLLSPFATKIFNSFGKNSYAYPVKDEFFTHSRLRSERVKTIFFLGGSKGALAINRLALDLASFLKDENIQIIHQCGNANLEATKKAYADLGIKADVFGFCDNLALKMKTADLAIARAGAGSLFELCANLLPCIFVPYPYAANNHQLKNAQSLKEKNLCFVQEESKINLEEIKQIILSDNSKISNGLQGFVSKFGAKNIIDTILQNF